MALLRRLTGEQRRTVAHWAMELVIVVAGVLIALWVQQWADRRRAHEDMVAAEAAIHDELRGSLMSLIWREAISQCHIERAEKLRSMLVATDGRWPGLPDNALLHVALDEATGVRSVMPGVYPRPNDNFAMAAWNSALTTGALAPMDRERFALIANTYSLIEFLRQNQEKQDRAAATLSALYLAQELTADSRTRMLQALYEVDTARFMFELSGAAELAGAMKQLGWNDRAQVSRLIAEDEQNDVRRRARWRPCVQRQENPFAA